MHDKIYACSLKLRLVAAALIALAFATAARATEYYWVGSSGAEWANAANWQLADGTTASAYPNAVADAEAVFTNDASVVLNSLDITVSNLTLKANVTISGSKYLMPLHAGDSTSTNVLTLDGGYLMGYQSGSSEYTITNFYPICITGSGNKIYSHQHKVSKGCQFFLAGAMTGSGSVECTVDKDGSSGGVHFAGAMSAFYGTITMTACGSQKNGVDLAINAPNSTWNVFETGTNQCAIVGHSSDYRYYNQYGFFRGSNDSTYTFGAINGSIGAYSPTGCIDKNITDKGKIQSSVINVGNLNTACTLWGDWDYKDTYANATGTKATTFNWVATTATLTYCVTNTANMNITGGGKVVFPTEAGTPTNITITASGGTVNPAGDVSAALVASAAFGVEIDSGKGVDFASALPAQAFTKSGDGVLTNSAALANADITVSAGTFAVTNGTITSLAISSGATLVYYGDSSSTLHITATSGTLAADFIQVTNGGTIQIPYDTELYSAIRTAAGDDAAIEYAPTSAVSWEPSSDALSCTFASGSAFTITTCSLKAGDTIMKLPGDCTGKNYTFTFLSPNTGTTSPFYGTPTPTYDSSTGYTTFAAAYASDVYVWNGTDGTAWNTSGSWKLGGATAPGYPDANTNCVIEAAASISCGSAKAKNLLLLGDLTLTKGNKPYTLEFGLNDNNASNVAEGPGKIILNGCTGLCTTQLKGKGTGVISIYSDIVVSSAATLQPGAYRSSQAAYLDIYGAVTGSADITVDDLYSSGSTIKPGFLRFFGDMSGYTGTMTTEFDAEQSYLQFGGAATNLASATVVLYSTGNASNLCATAGTYTFGSLSGKVTGGSEDVTLVVNGGTSIAYTKGTSDWNLTYGAAKKLTVTGDNFGVYTLASKLGSIVIPSAITDSQLGENTKRSDSDELLLVTSLEFTEEELLELKQIQVDDDCITNIAPNTVAAAISASWDIAEPVAIEGAGGLDFGEYTLTLSDGGILVLNPPRSSIKLTSAPTLSGGKFALASEYKNCTCGQFILCSWTDGSSLSFPSDQDTIFTNTTSATSYMLEETTDGDIKRLVLTLGDYKTSPVKTFTLLPIGDSITEGAEKTSGDVSIPNYRIPLCEKLTAAGYDVTTLGYLRTKCVDASGVNAPAQWTSHSGRGGEKLIWYPSTSGKDRGAVREAIDALLDQAGSADVVTLKLGTNDIQHEKDSGNFDEDVYIASLTNVIWKILNYAPKTKVVVSTLLDLTAYNSELPDKCNEKIRGLFADGNEYGFPENRVFLADNYTFVPRYIDGVYQKTYLDSGNVHPNWKGHDLFSDGWFIAVTNALATGEASGDRTACTTTGAANNVPAAYTNGFTQAATLDLANDGKFYLAPNTAPTYTTTNADAPTNKLGRIAYYLELKRKDNNSDEHVRWVWVDIPAFGDRTLAACGFPGNYSKFGQVSGVHIVSNDGAIHQVAADDDTCTARLEFTYHGYSGASSGDEDAPADMNSSCDWNDTESTSSNYGSFQIHRILDDGEFFSNPAEVVFAFNKWSKGSSCTNEVGIGNFAQHTAGTSIDYTGTDAAIMTNMNACAYEVINLEIWTKPAEYVWTGEDETDDNWSTAANWKYLDDGETASEYPNGEANTVYFPATNSTCVLDVDATVADMVIEEGDSATLDDQEALTLSGDGTHTLTIKSAQNCYQGKNRKVIYDGAKVKFGNKYGRMGVALRSSTSSASSGTMIVKGSSEITVQTLYACGSDAWIYIDGGTVTVTSDMQVNNGGHIVISNGTVTANSLVRTKGSGSSEIEIYGGSVSIAKLALPNGGALTIDGGSVTINAIDGTIADSSSITVSESATMTFKDSTVASTFLSAVDEFEMTTRTITLESDQSTVDATSYYVLAPDAAGTGTSVTLADDVVAEIEDGTTALAGTGIPSFTVPSDNVKKGLYYGLSAATSPDETSVLAETQATSDGETITLTPGSLDFSSSNVYYFRFTTSDEAQKE